MERKSYLCYRNITINNGATLTINPGISVIFQGYYFIDVQGRLLAIGTENDSIKFTTNPAVTRANIRFDHTPTANDSSKFVYCVLENGDIRNESHYYTGAGIDINTFNKILIKNCCFKNNYAYSFFS